jgi:hypothetical protein
MRVLITGANGQLGGALQRTAPAWADVNAIDVEDVDLTDAPMLRARLVVEAPDIILNAAAYTAVDKAESEEALARAINAEAVGVMVEAMADTGGKVVHVSTDYVFDGKASTPYAPDAPRAPLAPAGRLWPHHGRGLGLLARGRPAGPHRLGLRGGRGQFRAHHDPPDEGARRTARGRRSGGRTDLGDGAGAHYLGAGGKGRHRHLPPLR